MCFCVVWYCQSRGTIVHLLVHINLIRTRLILNYRLFCSFNFQASDRFYRGMFVFRIIKYIQMVASIILYNFVCLPLQFRHTWNFERRLPFQRIRKIFCTCRWWPHGCPSLPSCVAPSRRTQHVHCPFLRSYTYFDTLTFALLLFSQFWSPRQCRYRFSAERKRRFVVIGDNDSASCFENGQW